MLLILILLHHWGLLSVLPLGMLGLLVQVLHMLALECSTTHRCLT
jgi:hypothetical protein